MAGSLEAAEGSLQAGLQLATEEGLVAEQVGGWGKGGVA